MERNPAERDVSLSPETLIIVGALLVVIRGGNIEQAEVSPSKEARQAKVCVARPGSESRADACVDNPGTREIPMSPPESNRIGAKPVKQSPGSVLVSGHRPAKTDRAGGIAERAASEAGERDRGSLSTLIVPSKIGKLFPGGAYE